MDSELPAGVGKATEEEATEGPDGGAALRSGAAARCWEEEPKVRPDGSITVFSVPGLTVHWDLIKEEENGKVKVFQARRVEDPPKEKGNLVVLHNEGDRV
jgi:hypothetical protein